MKTIGFIDYYLDEWHANNYPKMIHNATAGEMEVKYAYGHIDSPKGGLTSEQWAEKFGVELVCTMEELVDKSDYIVVLSPDNPEMHEELSSVALKTGKRVYIDKTFATDKEMAERIFALADKYNTPCFTCSALNFSDELINIDKEDIISVSTVGPGRVDEYSIHQLEPIIKLFAASAKRVMSIGTDISPSVLIEFEDGRRAQIAHHNMASFWLSVDYQGKASKQLEIKSDFFANFIKEMIKFFETGEIPVSHEQTMRVMAVRAAAIKALKKPLEWVEV